MSWDFGGGTDDGVGGSWESRERPGGAPAPAERSHVDPSGSQLAGTHLATTSPPLAWLVLSLVLALTSISLHFLTDGLLPAVLAWLVGGPVAIGLFAVFVQADTIRRADPFYAESGLADWVRRTVVVISLVAVALNAWSIADYIARGGFK